jgi:hypothetical protein
MGVGRFQRGSAFFLPTLPCRPFPLEGFDLVVGPLLSLGQRPGFFLVSA